MKNYQERTQNILQKTKKIKSKRRIVRTAAVLSACSVAFGALNLWLFLPLPPAPSRLAGYEDSEYYSVMLAVDNVTYKYSSTPSYKNNWEKLCDTISGGFQTKYDTLTGGMGVPESNGTSSGATGDMDDSLIQAPGSSGGEGSSAGGYEEVTNNQVDGVIEADLFKRTNSHIFHLRAGSNVFDEVSDTYREDVYYSGNGYILSAYTIDEGNSQRVGKYEIVADEGMRFYPNQAEMYLSADGNTVTIITPAYDNETSILYTAAIALDVSNPTAVTEKNRQYVSGSYITSRSVGGQLLLISNFTVKSRPDYAHPEQYLPQVGSADGMQSIPAEDIYLPELANLARYTVITTLDASSLEINDSFAFFAYSSSVYVSQNNIFTTKTRQTSEQINEYVIYDSVTDVSCVSYADGDLALLGTATVKGTIENQYSMDEYQNTLRVFTTTASTIYMETVNGETASIRWLASHTNASLYCVDLTSFETVAKVERFAPEGETVQSARFDREKAYVCTALVRTMTDPVFAFDLSDLSNITYTDTGEIKGYSFSLTTFKDGTLLGIGYNANRSLKIELYEETAGGVQSVAVYEPSSFTNVSEDYKAHFIDASKGYVGFADASHGEYTLLHYDGYALREVFRAPFHTRAEFARACMVDGWIYILGEHGMKAIEVY